MIVYRLTCLPTGKIYIGITARSAGVRLKEHLANAARMVADRRHLYSAMRKYPAENWTTEIIGTANSWADLCCMEIRLIAEHNSFRREIGYNSTRGGDGVVGMVWTAEMRQRASNSHKGVRLSDAAKQKLKTYWLDPDYRENALRGLRSHKNTPEQIERRARALRGKNHSAETRARIGAALRGKKKSPHHIANSAFARLGYKKTADQIERSASFHRGRKRSDETRALLSANMKRRWRDSPKKYCQHRGDARRDAAIARRYYSAGSYGEAGRDFGIKAAAAWAAVSRFHLLFWEWQDATGYGRPAADIPKRLHPSWIEMMEESL